MRAELFETVYPVPIPLVEEVLVEVLLVEGLLVEGLLLKGFCLRYSRLRGCMNGIIAYNGKRNSCKGISLRENTGGNTCSNGITAHFFGKSLKKVHYYIQKKYLSSRIFFEVAKSRKMVQYYIQKKYLSSFFLNRESVRGEPDQEFPLTYTAIKEKSALGATYNRDCWRRAKLLPANF